MKVISQNIYILELFNEIIQTEIIIFDYDNLSWVMPEDGFSEIGREFTEEEIDEIHTDMALAESSLPVDSKCIKIDNDAWLVIHRRQL